MTTIDTRISSIRAMATDVVIYGHLEPQADRTAEVAIDRAAAHFGAVEAACTRFDPHSPLMRVNEQPGVWHIVPEVLFLAIAEAHRAYRRTNGLFDPRVLGDLVDLGYERSFALGPVDKAAPRRRRLRPAREAWVPRFRAGEPSGVHVGGIPIDLGGIGKGLAVRWASEELDGPLDSFLIDAGGDCYCRGLGPEGTGWRVAVEDPAGGETPLVVLELRDAAVATSSVRLRRWQSGGRTVHHLIDPRTGEPGGAGLLAVTVVGADPAEAEVLSKALFLTGRERITAEAARRGVAAFWVHDDGSVSESTIFGRHVLWRAA